MRQGPRDLGASPYWRRLKATTWRWLAGDMSQPACMETACEYFETKEKAVAYMGQIKKRRNPQHRAVWAAVYATPLDRAKPFAVRYGKQLVTKS